MGDLGHRCHFITFTSPDPDNLPVPSKEYFQLHRMCALALNLSGAQRYIQDIVEIEEETKGERS